jgi:AraC family transcriptional regulator, exoenzyme S synthesis regulatory protein ExsA
MRRITHLIMINYYKLLIEHPESFKQFSCKEVLFLNYDCPVKEKKLAKWSEHNYIYYVLTGKKIVHTPEKSWTLTKGKAVFVKRGACIVEQFFREPFCVVVFVMPDSFITSFLKETADHLPASSRAVSNDQVIPVDADALLLSFYQSVLPYFSSPQPPPEALIELKFKELLVHVLNNPANIELINYFHTLSDGRAISLETVMEKNYPYNLSLEEYARLCNRSLSSFKRDFQQIFKMNPGKWLLEKRLARAHQLLKLYSDKPVADVALESGFENVAHFSKVFKSRYGFSPLNLKKQLHEKDALAQD